MKVGQEGVHHPERIARGDVEARRAVERTHAAVGGRALQRPRRRRTDRDDPAAVGSRPVHGVGHARGDDHPLRRQDVVLELLCLDRAKRARADVERELVDLDAATPERVQDAGSEMKPGGRRGDRPRRPRVDGLVALAVLRGRRREPSDVGRERWQAVCLHQLVERTVQPLDDARTVGVDADDAQSRRRRLTDHELHADAATAPRPHQRPPAAAVDRLDEQQLDRAPAGVPRHDPRRDHARVVDDEAVPWPQQVWKLGEPMVLEASATAIDHEEPRRVARRDGRLRDQLRRQVVVELGQVHDAASVPRALTPRPSPGRRSRASRAGPRHTRRHNLIEHRGERRRSPRFPPPTCRTCRVFDRGAAKSALGTGYTLVSASRTSRRRASEPRTFAWSVVRWRTMTSV